MNDVTTDFIILMAYLYLVLVPLFAVAYIAAQIIFKYGKLKKTDEDQLEEYKQFKRLQQEAEHECINNIKYQLYDQDAKIVNLEDYRRLNQYEQGC